MPFWVHYYPRNTTYYSCAPPRSNVNLPLQVLTHIANAGPEHWHRLVSFLPPTAASVDTNSAEQLLSMLAGVSKESGDTTNDGILDGEQWVGVIIVHSLCKRHLLVPVVV